ncbi:hypothetical protein [Flavobacterium cheonanense]
MKTNYFFTKKISIYSVFGVLALIGTSCGSYQNTSYYDNDGIYGSTDNKPKQTEESKANSAYYKEYFSSLKQESEEVFTDVETYSSYNDTVSRNQSQTEVNYAGWGSNNSENIIVNVYDNGWGWNNWGWNNGWGMNNWGWNNWGWNNGWGWNNWYGPGWGWNNWGWNNGWSWNNWYGPGWGWNNGWYGNGWGWNNGWNGNNYAFSNGRRNTNYNNNINNGLGNRRVSNIGNTRNTNTIRSSYQTDGVRRTNTTVRNPNTTRNDSQTGGVRTTSPTRNDNNTVRPTTSPVRTSTNTRSYDSPRSYSPSPSSGGGGSFGGGGGGGRSSGGGRR